MHVHMLPWLLTHRLQLIKLGSERISTGGDVNADGASLTLLYAVFVLDSFNRSTTTAYH